jgi:L-glutamine:2-deoxy-scyllo-inosose/3-amino-2,3-dideoxy-scyllo-inosose aminotransferase
VVTDDDDLVGRLEELRADSRRSRAAARPGELDLAETASILGANLSISEFGAALLCAQLQILDRQHDRRNANYHALTRLLAGIPGVRLLQQSPAQDRLSLYEVPILFDDLPPGADNAWLAAALTEELKIRAYTPRPPLHRSRLLQPSTKSTLKPLSRLFHEHNDNRVFPGAEWLAGHAVLLHHSAFLGPPEDMRDIANAVAKVAAAAEA